MQVAPPSHDLLVHARTVISIILGLSMARLLNGVAGLIQHPKKEHLWWPHLCWVIYMMVSIVTFWWWQFQLNQLKVLTFETYIFLITEAAMLFMLCSVIFPTEISEYDGYADYFLSRRAWFFGLLIVSLLMDVADTWLKGAQHFAGLGVEYPVRIALMVGLCLTACFVRNVRFHAVYAVGALIYFVSYVARHYSTIQ
jgi:hypothetical protein